MNKQEVKGGDWEGGEYVKGERKRERCRGGVKRRDKVRGVRREEWRACS